MNKLFLINEIESHFDCVAIYKYLVDGKPAIILPIKGGSIHGIGLLKDEPDTYLTTLQRKTGSLLVCPWPSTKIEDPAPSK